MTTPTDEASSGAPLRIDVRLCGAPAVTFGGDEVRFRSRKVLALLVYLAVTDEPHTREHLIALLWPESDRERGRTSLRSALRNLEQAMPFDQPVLLRDQDRISIDPAVELRTDIALIDRAAEGEIAAIDTALQTPLGEFLEGFSLADADPFHEWTEIHRQHVRRQTSLLYRRRCDELATDPAMADELLQMAGRWARTAPTDEAACRALMRGHAMVGDKASASEAFQRCAAAVRAELGVEVLPETRALYDTIRTLPVAGSSTSDRSGEPDPVSPPLPLAGRRHDHLRLESALRLARQGTTNVVAVSGVAGIGKTRLVEQFLHQLYLDDQHTTVLRGRTFEFGGQVAYQSVLGMLRDHLATVNAPDDLLDDVWLSELSRLMPELRDRYPDLAAPASGEPEFERTRWFEAVAQLGRALAADQPLVVFLDDLHWADSGSFDLLHYLVLRWQQWRLPLTLIAAFRKEHLVAGQPLDSWLRRLERDLPLVRVELDPLDSDAIAEIVAWLDNGESTQQDKVRMTEWFATNTGGHPLFVVELARALLAQAGQELTNLDSPHSTHVAELLESVDQSGRPPIPLTVRDTIEARLASLSEGAADVLLASAVLGQPAQMQELAIVAGRDDASTMRAVEDLVRAQLVSESIEALAPYSCNHDLIREAAHDGAGEARRRLWHRRAFELVESMDGAPAARLAFHALSARMDAAALAYSLAAGETALAAFAGETAVQHFDDAEPLARALEAGANADVFRLFEGRGAALELINRHQAALDDYAEMEGLAVAQRDEPMELRAIVAQALIRSLPTLLHDPALGRALSLRALAKARALGDNEREARALWCLLLADLHDVADKEQAWQNGMAGVEITEALGLASLRAYILNDLHKIAMMQGNTSGALSTIEQAIHHWNDVGNIPMLMDSYSNLSFLYCNVGRLDEALELTDRCVEHARDLGNDWHLMNAPPSSIWAHREFGDYGKAISILEESLARSEPFGEIYVVNYSFALALVHYDLGAFDRMRELCRVADSAAVHEGYAGFVNLAAGFESLRVRADLAAGRDVPTPDFETLTAQVLDASFFYPSTPFHWLTATEVGRSQGHTASSVALAKTIVETLERFGIQLMLADAHVALAQGLADQGDLDAALTEAVSAAEVADAIGSVRSRWQAAVLSADLLDRTGRPDQASTCRELAKEMLAEILDATPAPLRSGFEATALVQRTTNP